MKRLTLLMFRWIPALLLVISAGLASGCSASDRGSGGRVGDLVSMTPLGREGGVLVYKLKYLTTPLSGSEPVVASGLLLVPDAVTSDTLTSYQHGSSVPKDDVPTVSGSVHREAAVTMANSGRMVVAADYLGLGDSEGPHPWLDAGTEASATSELLMATPRALTQLGLLVPKRVDLVGFSQGAHASMAVARELEKSGEARPFETRSVYGIAGPYRLNDVDVPALMNGDTDPMVRSLALARMALTAETLGYDVGGMYAPGARDLIQRQFDGTRTDEDVVRALPGEPSELFTEQGWQDFRDPRSGIGQWLSEASGVCRGWGKDADVTLLHARGDTAALPRNSQLCGEELRESGANLRFEDLGGLEHIPSGEAGRARVAELLQERDSRLS